MHEAHELWLAREQPVERIEVEVAVVEHGHVGELRLAVLAEQLPRNDVGMVLHLGQHHEVAAVPLAISDDAPAALTAFRGELSRYLTLPFYRAMLESSGLGKELATFDRSGEVAEPLPRALGAVGAPAAGRAFVQAYRDPGVTLPAIRPITFPAAPWYRRTLEEASGW